MSSKLGFSNPPAYASPAGEQFPFFPRENRAPPSPPLTPVFQQGRITKPPAMPVRRGSGKYQYFEIQSDYTGHNPDFDDYPIGFNTSTPRTPTFRELEDLQLRKGRDAKLKSGIRKFRFFVRLADLGCRYEPFLMYLDLMVSAVVIGLLSSNLAC